MAAILRPTATDVGDARAVDAELDQTNDQVILLGRTGQLAHIDVRQQPRSARILAISRP